MNAESLATYIPDSGIVHLCFVFLHSYIDKTVYLIVLLVTSALFRLLYHSSNPVY